MSSLSGADLFYEDILGTLRLKPWWEVCREYAFKLGLAVIALFALFLQTGLNCLHYTETDVDRIDLSDVQAQAVNAYCKSVTLPWLIRYRNLITFGITISIFIAANFWLHVNGVTKQLREMSDSGHGIIELSMSEKEMENRSALPVTATSDHEQQQLRRFVLSLFRLSEVTTLSKWYARRCVLVLLLTFVTGTCLLGFALTFEHVTLQIVATCEVSNTILNLGPINVSNKFQCVNETSDINGLFEIIFGLTILLQTLAMCVAVYKQKTNQTNQIRPNQPNQPNQPKNNTNHQCEDLLHFLIMMMGVGSDQQKKISCFIKYVFSEDFTKKLSMFSDEAILAEDVEFYRILRRRLSSEEKFWEEVGEKANRVLWDGDNRLGADQNIQNSLDSDSAVYLFLYSIEEMSDGNETHQHEQHDDQTNQETEQMTFYEDTRTRCNWHLLSCSPFVRRMPEFFHDIKFDRLDQKGRSYLFYVLRKSSLDRSLPRFLHFNEILRKRQNASALVHFDGITMTSEDFFHSEYPRTFRGLNPDFRKCHVERDECVDECAAEYKNLCDAYCRDSGAPVGPGPLERYFAKEGEFKYETFIDDLNSIKLSALSSSCKIAEKAISDEKWEVLVALINTLIVTHNGRVRPKTHVLTAGNENENDIFNLKSRDDLEEIFKEALRRPRNRMYFVPTAAEHVMSIMDPEFREEMMKHVENAPLPTDAKRDLRDRAYAFNISNLSNFVEPLDDNPSTSRATNMYASLDLHRMVC